MLGSVSVTTSFCEQVELSVREIVCLRDAIEPFDLRRTRQADDACAPHERAVLPVRRRGGAVNCHFDFECRTRLFASQRRRFRCRDTGPFVPVDSILAHPRGGRRHSHQLLLRWWANGLPDRERLRPGTGTPAGTGGACNEAFR